MEITIREAMIEDLPELLAINLSSFEANEMHDPYIDMNWVHTQSARNYFTKAITDTNHYTILAEADGASIGFLILVPKVLSYRTVKTTDLDTLAVMPKYRSSGVGSKLVAAAKKWAKNQGYQTIYVNAYIQNDRAVNFYKKQGFTPIDISLEHALD